MSKVHTILESLETSVLEQNTATLFADIRKTMNGDRTNPFSLMLQKRGVVFQEDLNTVQDIPHLRSILGGLFMNEVSIQYGLYL